MTAYPIPMSVPQTLAMGERIPTPQAAPVEEALNSERLLNGRREILIRHGDRVYRLRHTSNDKLILTK
ncbi:MAG TPA: hemin uptake protein HemP [Pseudoxanthomonas sp.]